ncbi:MAG: alpha/beta fold hydrolase [Bacteroidota bacterium]
MSSNDAHLVFVHGNSSSDKVFESQKAFFDNRTILKLPGHSDLQPSSEPHIDYTNASLKNYIKEKCEELGECVLVANSLGGHLAIEAAPEIANLKALIILGTPPVKKPLNIEEAFLPTEALASYFKGEYEEPDLRKNLSVAVYDSAHTEILVQDFMKTDPRFRDIWTKDTMENNGFSDQVDIVANLSVPIYVIHGKQDPSVNIEYVRRLKGITKIYEIDECGHYPSLEQPDKFNAIIEDILKEV